MKAAPARSFAAARSWACVAFVAFGPGCTADRSVAATVPVYDADIGPLLLGACAACHGVSAPAAGWSVTTFLGTIACVTPSGAPATLPPDSRAPILAALATPPHLGLLNPAQIALLSGWVAAGTPGFRNGVHPPGIADPRSADFHGTALRASHWQPMLDPGNASACGGCHLGTPGGANGLQLGAPGATACTTCHTEPQGALACDTCHGSNGNSYPPRDPCFFPGDAVNAGAHAIHVQSSPELAGGMSCAGCHPSPGDPIIGGLHGNGTVDIQFDTTLIGPEASFDSATGSCSVTCHDSGGARPRPAWSESTRMGCNDCHRSPPANHFPGACTGCHSEANATGTALTGGSLHLDGHVELGNGSGLCGACHGTGADPWPTTAAHPAHHDPTLTVPVACASCHRVPTTILDPIHLDGVVTIAFTGLAVARASSPVWNGVSCSQVACHGANLADPAAVPVWTDTSGAAAKCGACHGIPPSEHTTSTACGRSDCHGGEVDVNAQGTPSITDAGKMLHINGVIDYAR